jgi:zinc/manganese transport system ATP-binding protein
MRRSCAPASPVASPDDLVECAIALRRFFLAAPGGRRYRAGLALGGDCLGGRGMTASIASIRLTNLTVAYDRHPAFHHLDGGFEAGSLTAIVGPNGAGKSTLLRTIVGTLKPVEGNVRCSGIDRRDLAYLPQQAEIDRLFPITVADIVISGAWKLFGAFGRANRAVARRAEEALSGVGLEGFGRRPVGSLSAGQFQRALFARLLLQDSPIILLDEPFTAIDARTTADLLRLIECWHGEARTIVAVLHDLDQVRRHFPRTLLLARERIGWGPTDEVLTPENLLLARRLSEAWDERAQPCTRGTA